MAVATGETPRKLSAICSFAHLHQLEGPCLGATGHWCQTCLKWRGESGIFTNCNVTLVVQMLGSLSFPIRQNGTWELRVGRWFPCSNGSSWGSMLSRVVYIQSGRNEWSRKPMKIWPALVASSWKAASSSSQACNLHCCSGYNISNSRSWPCYCLPSKSGGSRIKKSRLVLSWLKFKEREREREGVERNPSPLYEVQWSMISYNWGGLEGQGSVESAVHIEPILTHLGSLSGLVPSNIQIDTLEIQKGISSEPTIQNLSKNVSFQGNRVTFLSTLNGSLDHWSSTSLRFTHYRKSIFQCPVDHWLVGKLPRYCSIL